MKKQDQRRLAFEELEERLVLTASVTAVLPSYEEWRTTTFTLSAMELETSFPVESTTGDVSVQLTQSDDLIGLDKVRSLYPYTGTGYTVVVIDTGVDYNHSALGGGWGNRVIAGWDFVDDDSDPMDQQGHGTHVAGIIGSSNSTYKGIAPNVNIIALRVLDSSGSGSFGDVEDALRWVINNQSYYNIVSVNMSLGAGNYSYNPYTFMDDEFSSLVNQGVLVAVSSGNSFYSYGSAQGTGFPATSSNVVAVGAVWDANVGSVSWSDGARDYTTAADRITSFTQRGPALDILAPGAYVTSSYLGGGYATMAGTSMAAPMIAGAAALIHQAMDATGQGHLANQTNILNIMKSTGVNIVDGDDENDNVNNTGLTFKRLDLYAALASVVGSGNTAPTINPINNYTIPHGQDLTVAIQASDSDNDSIQLSAAILTSGVPATVSFNGQNLLIDIAPNYAGAFQVRVTASDGTTSTNRTFSVTVTNNAPVISAIADKTLTGLTDVVKVTISATDADSDSLVYSASVTSIPWNLKQQYGFKTDGNLKFNSGGLQEKWFQNAAGAAFFILPNGNIYRHLGGVVGNNEFVAATSVEIYDDLSLLFNAANPATQVTISLVGNKLTVTPTTSIESDLIVTVNASDGIVTSSKTFNIRVENQKPSWNTIANKVVSHGQPVVVSLAATDSDGDAISYSATIVHSLYTLKQEHQFYAKASYYTNLNGIGDKWIFGKSGNYFILPDGGLYLWLGSGGIGNNKFIANVGTAVYQNPALLHDLSTNLATSATVQVVGNQLTILPPADFLGPFTVVVTASDWVSSTSTSFEVLVKNDAPVAQAIADKSIKNGETLTVSLAAADADGDSVTYSATIVHSLYALKQQHQFYAKASYSTNLNGIGEKWIFGTGGNYYLMPSGGLYLWLGSGGISNSKFIADVGTAVYENPALLHDLSTNLVTSATVQVVGNQLTIQTPADFLGPFTVVVNASDGTTVTSTSFKVNVVNHAPVIGAITDKEVGLGKSVTVGLSSTDADGDAVTYSATIVHSLYALKQQHQFYAKASYYTNINGVGDKWIFGTGGNYFLLPNGGLYLWLGSGGISNNTFIANVGTAVYENPALLTGLTANLASVANVQVIGSQLVIQPPADFVGPFTVTVTASDGVSSTTTSFNVVVRNNAPVISAISDKVVDKGASITVNLSATDADGDGVSYSAVVEDYLFTLKQQHQFYALGHYYTNLNGVGDKWIFGTGGNYFILPDGGMYLWLGSGGISNNKFIANVGTAVYEDPSLLHGKTTNLATVTTVQINGSQLVIQPPAGHVGPFSVRVTASDGAASSSISFNVLVRDNAGAGGIFTSSVTNQSLSLATAPTLASVAETTTVTPVDNLVDESVSISRFTTADFASASVVLATRTESNSAVFHREWDNPETTEEPAAQTRTYNVVAMQMEFDVLTQRRDEVDGVIRESRRVLSPRAEARMPDLADMLRGGAVIDIESATADELFSL